jgi:hypothetical protein
MLVSCQTSFYCAKGPLRVRDFVKVFYVRVLVTYTPPPPDPPTIVDNFTFIGNSPERAQQNAFDHLQQPPPADTSYEYIPLGAFYVLLNRDTIIQYLDLFGLGGTIQLNFQSLTSITQVAAVYGVDPQINPRKQAIYPWNGKRKRSLKQIQSRKR